MACIRRMVCVRVCMHVYVPSPSPAPPPAPGTPSAFCTAGRIHGALSVLAMLAVRGGRGKGVRGLGLGCESVVAAKQQSRPTHAEISERDHSPILLRKRGSLSAMERVASIDRSIDRSMKPGGTQGCGSQSRSRALLLSIDRVLTCGVQTSNTHPSSDPRRSSLLFFFFFRCRSCSVCCVRRSRCSSFRLLLSSPRAHAHTPSP